VADETKSNHQQSKEEKEISITPRDAVSSYQQLTSKD
jgi:hypothetical protein